MKIMRMFLSKAGMLAAVISGQALCQNRATVLSDSWIKFTISGSIASCNQQSTIPSKISIYDSGLDEHRSAFQPVIFESEVDQGDFEFSFDYSYGRELEAGEVPFSEYFTVTFTSSVCGSTSRNISMSEARYDGIKAFFDFGKIKLPMKHSEQKRHR